MAAAEHASLRGLPNLLTAARLGAVPFTTWLILRERHDLACVLFALAGLTDALDGWLARRLGAHTSFGALLDPLADKALLAATYASLAWTGMLPAWLALMVLGRDAAIAAGYVALRRSGRRPSARPLAISKWNTAVQVAVAFLALALGALGRTQGPVLDVAVAVAASTTLASAAAYARLVLRGTARPTET